MAKMVDIVVGVDVANKAQVITLAVRSYGNTRTEMEAYALSQAQEWAEDDTADIHVVTDYLVKESRYIPDANGAKWYADISVHILDNIDVPEFMRAAEEVHWPKDPDLFKNQVERAGLFIHRNGDAR